MPARTRPKVELELLALVRSIHLQRKTGLVELETEGSEKHLYFVAGDLFLLASGRSARTIARLLRSQVWGDAGSEQTLTRLYAKIAERFARWHTRSFSFTEGIRVDSQGLVGPLPTARILMAAACEEQALERLRQRLGAPGAKIVAEKRPTGQTGVSAVGADEIALLSLVRRPLALDELLAQIGDSRPRPFMEIARLWAVGLIREASEETAPDVDSEGRAFEAGQQAGVAPLADGNEVGEIWRGHFGIERDPFSLTPDPSFLFISDGHGEALAGLKLGLLERRGLIAMTGEVGTGKTTLLYALLSGLDPKIEAAYIYNTSLSFEEILKSALADFGVPCGSGDRLDLLEALNGFLARLAASDRTAALVIDEAQNLSDDTFEQLRLLLNFETYDHKLLQIVLVGQPELARRLGSQQLRQVADRIAVRCRLDPLSRDEARQYVVHRLAAAGGSPRLFSRRALRLVVRKARGIPRRINVVCHNAMLFAYAAGARTVGRAFVLEALREGGTSLLQEIRRRYGPKKAPGRGSRSSTFRDLSAWIRTARARWLLLGLAALTVMVLGWLSGSQQQQEPGQPHGTDPVNSQGHLDAEAQNVGQSRALSSAAAPLAQGAQPTVAPFRETRVVGARRMPKTGTTTVSLRLRSGPGLGFTALGLLPRGYRVEILGQQQEWLRVAAPDHGGVDGTYLARIERQGSLSDDAGAGSLS